MKNYLQEVATMAVTYSEALDKDESKVAETLGNLYRMHQDKIKDLAPRELALLTTFISEENKEDYEEFVTMLGTKDVLEEITKTSISPQEEISKLDYIEGMYLASGMDYKDPKSKQIFANIAVNRLQQMAKEKGKAK